MAELENSPINISTLDCVGGVKIGFLTLSSPKSLNSLSLEMVEILLPQLLSWQDDENIVAVVLRGEGDKAFCAGGDVVSLYNAMLESPGKTPDSVETFFTKEYQLDYLIHSYSKPIVVWGNGIVMGGGMGLLMGASHRVVTGNTRMAMPEITIGLYPDVGGSYFLNKMPSGCGMFLGLTGASINGADAIYLGLSDHFCLHADFNAFCEAISSADWKADSAHETVSAAIRTFESAAEQSKPQSNVAQHQALLSTLAHCTNTNEVVKAIQSFDSQDDRWLQKAQKTLASGSPITMHLVHEQLNKAKDMNLAECFRMELTMSCKCAAVGEFQEGVRALLIEKDMQPQWLYPNPESVPHTLIESFFHSSWSEEDHPLRNLEGDNL